MPTHGRIAAVVVLVHRNAVIQSGPAAHLKRRIGLCRLIKISVHNNQDNLLRPIIVISVLRG
ncbi:hypothetical protein OH687_33625 [Burkholderia anthina]|nr:hypothetical protein OH687_33625 [Burkholderia anthina]